MTMLDECIAQLAAQIAHTHDWSLGDATAWVQMCMAEAYDDYR